MQITRDKLCFSTAASAAVDSFRSLSLSRDKRNCAKKLHKMKNIGGRICDWRNLWPTDVSLSLGNRNNTARAQCKDLSEALAKIMVHGTCNSAAKLNKPTERRKRAQRGKSRQLQLPFFAWKWRERGTCSKLWPFLFILQKCTINLALRRTNGKSL